jgi:hypothetical protein
VTPANRVGASVWKYRDSVDTDSPAIPASPGQLRGLGAHAESQEVRDVRAIRPGPPAGPRSTLSLDTLMYGGIPPECERALQARGISANYRTDRGLGCWGSDTGGVRPGGLLPVSSGIRFQEVLAF